MTNGGFHDMATEENLREAFGLRKSQHFQEAIGIYRSLWKDNPERFSDWDGWSYAYCLFKLDRYQEALDICRRLYPGFKNSEILNSLYAKCIFYTQFASDSSTDLSILKKAVLAMYRLSPPYNPYSLTSRAIFKLIKIMMAQQVVDWKEIEIWLDKMDPDLLDNKPVEITGPKGKKFQLASLREEWYANMIRVKGGLNQPAELLNWVETARRQGIQWHYNNDIWFERKEAFALNELGRKAEAEKLLRKILTVKRDWFLVFDLAGVVENEEEKTQLLAEAALLPGKMEMKLKLYQKLYEHLKNKFPEESALHLCLIAAIREENGWPVKQELRDEIAKAGIIPVKEGSSTVILKRLMSFWKKFIPAQKFENGIVDILFPNNKAGFIKCGDKKYFFKTGNFRG